jgi:hypothetical protein
VRLKRETSAPRAFWGSTIMNLRLLAAALIIAGGARAAPPDGADPNGPMADWYRSLQAPDTGGSCCSLADCRPVEARQAGVHWEIWTETGWQAVPLQRVLRRENLDGRPIACRRLGEILCFVPPADT